MNVLVVGGGGREHALAWKLRASPRLTDLFVAPGNAGTAAIAHNLPIGVMDFDAIAAACRAHRVDLVVVGPDDPLGAGLVDRLQAEGIAAYGPTAAAAQIEASKSFAKDVLARAGVPTASAHVYADAALAFAHLDAEERAGATPPVVKADGLALGKGVTVAETYDEARAAVRAALLDGAFGAAGARVLLEERMSGLEVSAHAFCDGATAVPMVYSCDYKRVGDGDAGPNTGGMGVYSPPGFVDDALAERIRSTIIQPTIATMAEMGRPFAGTLYPGLMLTPAGPKVVEFNCRFGDPEAQALLPRLDTDLLAIMEAAGRGRLAEVEIRWTPGATVAVVLASGGYPGGYPTGLPISGLDDVDTDALVFHAGTRREGDQIVTAGGRVLTVVGRGATLAEARDHAYANAARIQFDGVHYRRDIALRETTPAAAAPRG